IRFWSGEGLGFMKLPATGTTPIFLPDRSNHVISVGAEEFVERYTNVPLADTSKAAAPVTPLKATWLAIGKISPVSRKAPRVKWLDHQRSSSHEQQVTRVRIPHSRVTGEQRLVTIGVGVQGACVHFSAARFGTHCDIDKVAAAWQKGWEFVTCYLFRLVRHS